MDTIRITKKIESNDIHIEGLDRFKGRTAEIVVVIEDGRGADNSAGKGRAHAVIDSFAGKINKWERDELHAR